LSVPATTISLSGISANLYQYICLNSSGTPALVGVSASSFQAASGQVDNLINTNATTLGQPIACLAGIKISSIAGVISAIYDVRTYTTSIKTYGTDANSGDGYLGEAITNSSTGAVQATTSTTSPVLGVIVAYTGTYSTTGAANVIYTISGPTWIVAVSGTIGDYIRPQATAGVVSGAVSATLSGYDELGITLSTYNSTCSTQAFNGNNCNESIFTNLDIQ
jgi:hypothetical protein